ncbi:MAG: hypothetical protein KDN20_12790 [Verrucomicrobiae bacterium]|nr:hypothetical protein [Verrucomicrobiae bacterium]
MNTLRLLLGSFLTFSCAVAAFLFSGCATSNPTEVSTEKVDFVSQVKPILEERCVMCHNRTAMPERTSFETGKLALKGDAQGPVILPGKADDSRLMMAISSPDIHEKAMPPVSLRVSAGEKAVLRRWINEGAHWPEGADGRLEVDYIPRE